MAKKRRNKTSGTRACVCDLCGTKDPSTVQNTKHRRCGGAKGAERRPKHATASGARGHWV